MNAPPIRDVFFVYRAANVGPLGKHVARLPGSSVLAWFQRAWAEIRAAGDADVWLRGELGVTVHWLLVFFHTAIERGLEEPRTWEELRGLLIEEGGLLEVRGDQHALSVRTFDGGIDLATFFIDREYAERYADRVTYLLHEPWELPRTSGEGPFDPGQPVAPLRSGLGPCRGSGPGATYLCFLTFYGGNTFASCTSRVVPGVRLPELPAFLCQTLPIPPWDGNSSKRWPIELRLLRAYLYPDDRDLSRALRECSEYPLRPIGAGRHDELGTCIHKFACEDFEETAPDLEPGCDPSLSLVASGEHVAQLCMHVTAELGYQQWFLFDDLWAAAHPALARSLLLYAERWNPFELDERPVAAEPDEDPVADRIAAARSPRTRETLRFLLAQDEDPRVRLAVVQALREEPRLSDEIAALFAGDESAEIRVGLAQCPGTPARVRLLLARDEGPLVRCALVEALERGDPEAAEIERLLAGDPDVRVREAVAHEAAPPDVLARLAGDPAAEVRLVVAGNAWTPPDVLASFVSHVDPAVRLAVAKNVRAPHEALTRLAADADPTVRLAVAGNVASPTSALTQLAGDDDEETLVVAFGHKWMPPELLAEKARVVPHGSRVAWAVADNPACPAPTLEMLSWSPDPVLRRMVARNANTPIATAERLAGDEDYGVRLGAKVGATRRQTR